MTQEQKKDIKAFLKEMSKNKSNIELYKIYVHKDYRFVFGIQNGLVICPDYENPFLKDSLVYLPFTSDEESYFITAYTEEQATAFVEDDLKIYQTAFNYLEEHTQKNNVFEITQDENLMFDYSLPYKD